MSKDLIFFCDFVGYCGVLFNLCWLNGVCVVVLLVVNFEEGLEFLVNDGDFENEVIYEVVYWFDGFDSCIDSYFEYGMCVVWWCIMDLFDMYGVKVIVSLCGWVIECLLELVCDVIVCGYEIFVYGWCWQSYVGMDEVDECVVIVCMVVMIVCVMGQCLVGWYICLVMLLNMCCLLVEDGGFFYDSDVYNDDLFYYCEIVGWQYLVLFYVFDINDM